MNIVHWSQTLYMVLSGKWAAGGREQPACAISAAPDHCDTTYV